MALKEVKLVGHDVNAITFIGRILHIETTLRLLNEATKWAFVRGRRGIVECAPNLEILGSITSLIFRGALPGDNEGSMGRKADLVDIGN